MHRQYRMSFVARILVMISALTLPTGGGAQVTPEETAQVEKTANSEEGGAGLSFDLGFATAYVFRGFNVFQKNGQMDPYLLVAPGITWAIFDTGLSLGYWGAFQVSGPNIGVNIDAGLGAEQDLFVKYDLSFTDSLSLGLGLTAYMYPFADDKIAGATMPTYLEPAATLFFTTAMDMGLGVSYFLGLQDEPGIRGISYLYLHPTVGKTLELSSVVQLALGGGYGFKLFLEGNDDRNNIHDIHLDVALPIALGDTFYLSPSLHGGWTNIADSMTASGTAVSHDFGDGLFFYGGLNLGANF